MVKLCGENGRRTSGWGSLAVEYCCNGSKLLHVWNILYLHECHMFMIHVGTVHIPYMEHLGRETNKQPLFLGEYFLEVWSQNWGLLVVHPHFLLGTIGGDTFTEFNQEGWNPRA